MRARRYAQLPGTDGAVWTLDGYRAVRERAHEGVRAVVIGGGFIGSEIAASLTANGCPVTMIFPDPGLRILPAELSAYVTRGLPKEWRQGADRRDVAGG